MPDQAMHGVIGTSALSDDERAAVETLLHLCNHDEGINLILSLEPVVLDSRATGENVDQFLSYDHGALVGYARLDGWLEPELCGMVHPEYRCRGWGRSLLAAARAECARRGAAKLLLVCDEAAQSAQGFAAGISAALQVCEHRMRLDPAAIDRSRPRNPALWLRPATITDRDLLTRIQAAAFGDSEDEVREHVIQGLGMANRQYLLGMLDEQPIGLMRLGRYEQEADVTAFGVLPAYQGRGYGRQMLLDAIDLLLAEQWSQIMIDVVTENRGALKLYWSCGFREITTYGFYHLGV